MLLFSHINHLPSRQLLWGLDTLSTQLQVSHYLCIFLMPIVSFQSPIINHMDVCCSDTWTTYSVDGRDLLLRSPDIDTRDPMGPLSYF